jgi:Mg-chelatase subunit ChlD
MQRYLILTLLVLAFLGWAVREGYTQREADLLIDIVIILDNSGSMRAKDPGFLIKRTVTNFVRNLPTDSHVGFVIFSETAEQVMRLTPMAEWGTGQVTEALNRISYTGKHTNISDAIELAIYSLKRDGRAGTEKLIVLITGEGINTGSRGTDIVESERLKDVLAADSKKAGIKIFGIAFTNQADFELIETISRKTGGDPFRVYKAEHIQMILNSIGETISKPTRPVFQFQPSVKLIALAGLVVVGIVAFAFVIRGRRGKGDHQDKMIEAVLVDLGRATDKEIHKINKRYTTIGRTRGNDVDIRIGKNTISALHSQIEYKNGNFYLTDLRSRNGTYLNQGEEKITGEVCLKDNDVIVFDKYRFKFVLSGQGKNRLEGHSRDQTILRSR